MSYLNKGVDIIHESLSSTNDELVHTSNSMGSEDREKEKSVTNTICAIVALHFYSKTHDKTAVVHIL